MNKVGIAPVLWTLQFIENDRQLKLNCLLSDSSYVASTYLSVGNEQLRQNSCSHGSDISGRRY